jgi:hypothetical protein
VYIFRLPDLEARAVDPVQGYLLIEVFACNPDDVYKF